MAPVGVVCLFVCLFVDMTTFEKKLKKQKKQFNKKRIAECSKADFPLV